VTAEGTEVTEEVTSAEMVDTPGEKTTEVVWSTPMDVAGGDVSDTSIDCDDGSNEDSDKDNVGDNVEIEVTVAVDVSVVIGGDIGFVNIDEGVYINSVVGVGVVVGDVDGLGGGDGRT